MAKITRVSGPQTNPNPASVNLGTVSSAASGYSAIAQSQANLGRGLQQLAQTNPNVDDAQNKINAHFQDLQQSKTSLDSSMYASKMSEATVALNQAFLDRSSKTFDEQGNPTFTKLPEDIGAIGRQLADKVAGTISDPGVRQKFLDSFNSSIADAQIRSLSVAKNQQKDYNLASYNQFKDITNNQANVDDISMLPQHTANLTEVLMGQVAGGQISIQEAQKEIKDFETQVRINHVVQDINNDPTGTYNKLKQDPTSFGLDTEVVDTLTHKANAAVATQKAQEQATKNSIIEQYGDLFRQASNLQMQGKEVPAPLLLAMQDVSKGTLLEKDVNRLIKHQDVINEFSAKSPSERADILNQLDKEAITDPDLAGLPLKLAEINENINGQISKDPLQYMIDRNLIDKPQPLDFSQQTSTLAEQIRDRQISGSMTSAFTGIRSSGLNNQELNQLNGYLSSLSPLQQATQLSSMISTLGEGQYQSLLSDIKFKNENSLLPAVGADIWDGNVDFAQQVLSGQQAIKDKTAVMPKQDELLTAILKKIPNYKNPQQKSDTINRIINAYAAVSIKENLDKDKLNEVIKRAVNGGAVTFNKKLVEPFKYGQTEEQFIQDMTNPTGLLATHIQKLPAIGNTNTKAIDVIKSSYLQNVGKGVYTVHPTDSNEPSVLLDKNGQIWLLDMNKVLDNSQDLEISTFGNLDAPANLVTD